MRGQSEIVSELSPLLEENAMQMRRVCVRTHNTARAGRNFGNIGWAAVVVVLVDGRTDLKGKKGKKKKA